MNLNYLRIWPGFHISLLKEYYSKSPDNEMPNDIPAANDLIYGDDNFYVHKILDHKIVAHPVTYEKEPALLFLVRWENFGPADDRWEPYINLRRTDSFIEYLNKNDKFRLLIMVNEFKKLRSSYPFRFSSSLRSGISSLERVGM